MRTRVCAVFGLCAVLASLVDAQAPKVATVKEVLYSAADSIGQLRLAAEVDRIATMTYTATGTLTVGNQPCKLKEYKASVNWLHKGMRVDYTCDGQSRRIEVVNHDIAWNETMPGVGATPVPSGAAANGNHALDDGRWCRQGGDGGGARRPSQSKWQTVLSFPVVDVPGATIRRSTIESYPWTASKRLERRHRITYAEHGTERRGLPERCAVSERSCRNAVRPTIADLTVEKTKPTTPTDHAVLPKPEALTTTTTPND